MCIQKKMMIPAKSLKQEIKDSVIITTLPTLKYFQPPHSLNIKATESDACSTVTEDLTDSDACSTVTEDLTDSDACSTVTEDLTETLDNIDFTIIKSNEIAISDSSNLVKS